MSAQDAAGHELPQPSFEVLVQVLASPCYVHLGMVENPSTGKLETNLEQARWAIDLLGVLEEKTRGAVEEREDALLRQVLKQLRDAYAQKLA